MAETERKFPVDPHLDFPNVVVPVHEMVAEDYAHLMADAPIVNQDEHYLWHAVIDTEQDRVAYLMCTPKAWIVQD